MKFSRLLLLACAFPSAAFAAEPPMLKVHITGLDTEGRLLPRFAFCAPDKLKKMTDGNNLSPELSWEAGPEGTKSYAVIMHDADVPQSFEYANRENVSIPKSAPRADFVHWVLVDIPASTTRLPEGADSDKKEAKGKITQQTRYGLRGVNDYRNFYKGKFYGYDGPCPPWNDESWHHYRFSVYALDVPSLNLGGAFTGQDVRRAIDGHILARGQAVARYSLNADLPVPPLPKEEPVAAPVPEEPAATAPVAETPAIETPAAPETPAPTAPAEAMPTTVPEEGALAPAPVAPATEPLADTAVQPVTVTPEQANAAPAAGEVATAQPATLKAVEAEAEAAKALAADAPQAEQKPVAEHRQGGYTPIPPWQW